MLYTAPPAPALIDRLVLDEGPDDAGEPKRVSGLTKADRWVLLGEPGSGKSTTFIQAAAAEGSEAITARAFVEGARPTGRTLFIDALEEYRIGEVGHERLGQLAKAIKDRGYTQWRLTCRSASLNAPDISLLVKALGDFRSWHLAPLDGPQQRAILVSLGETNPDVVLQQIDDLAAAPLLGNPATLKLLYDTLSSAKQPIHSRGALLDHATHAMAEEINPDLPVSPERSTPGSIVAAAEKASLILMLSARNELWMLGSRPPRPDMVDRDDLLPAQVDTQALKDAVGTAMFRGEAGSFSPTHRMVAEYLAGRWLARATQSLDGAPAALPYGRAYALLCGEDNNPVPALLGTFAWFVTTLAHGPHAARALELLSRFPEAVLFQGDAAMLPLTHRRALLAATGRGDPWFLTGYQGATAIGGLAGDDLAAELGAILRAKTESAHRRGMVLEALSTGRRVASLDPEVEAFAIDAGNLNWLRRKAIDTLIARVPSLKTTLRRIVKGLAGQDPKAAMSIKLQALAELVRYDDVSTTEAHQALLDYAGTGDGVMGYGWRFGHELEARPAADFFETPIHVKKLVGNSRSYEVRGLIERILAALIRATPTAKAVDILRWLANAGFDPDDDPHEIIREAIKAWVGLRPGSASKLFWTLYRQSPGQAWFAPLSYSRLVGEEPPPKVVAEVLTRLKASSPGPKACQLGWLAWNVMGRFDPANRIYWDMWRILVGRPDLVEVFEALTVVSLDHWQARQARETKTRGVKEKAKIDEDRDWLNANLAGVRDGTKAYALSFAAMVYSGHYYERGQGYGRERLVSWIGEDLTRAVTQGWTVRMASFPNTWRQQARQETKSSTYNVNFLAAAWAEDRIARGETVSGLSLDAAFGILRGVYALQGEYRDAVERIAAERISRDDEGRKALISYWKTVTRVRPHDLPHVSAFEALGQADWAVEAFLGERPDPGEILRSALSLAARVMTALALTALVQKTLRKKNLSEEARGLWRFAAFLLDPARYETALAEDVQAAGAEAFANRINRGHLIYSFDRLTTSAAVRDRAIAQHLGPLFAPNDGFSSDRDDMSQVVATALKALAETPTAEASETLAALIALPTLSAWADLIRHHIAKQKVLRQQATFRAPLPKVVARAILAGPPASPADLRAVVREVLEDLARDVQDGDTSAWRGFWNYPAHDEDQWPKEENDCRDLLLDRVRDRLARFGVGGNRAFPESRRRNDRRADILLIGEDAASLPVEAKRHLNKEIWTAGATQLPDYGRSPGSEGHGVYLIFWFGVEVGPVPLTPAGVSRITSAEALRAALDARQPDALKPLIDIVVFDVSPPPTKRLKPKPPPTVPAQPKSPAKAGGKRNGPEAAKAPKAEARTSSPAVAAKAPTTSGSARVTARVKPASKGAAA